MQRFAFDLRALRDREGRLSYQELAKRAHYAPNTLSEAAKGEKLPTLEVVRAFVKACGADQDAWEQRWWEVQRQLGRDQSSRAAATRSGAAPPGPQSAAAPPEPELARRHRRLMWPVAAGVVVAALVSGGALWGAYGFFPATSREPRLVLLRQLRAVGQDGGYVRIWALTTDSTQVSQLTSSAGYQMTGPVGSCYTQQKPGTVPVWRHTYKFKDDRYEQHLYTIETDPRRDEALNWGWTRRDPRPLCYVYAEPARDTRPLYRMREGLDQTMAVGDRHGHVHTPSLASYRRFGFVVDQVWYLPTS